MKRMHPIPKGAELKRRVTGPMVRPGQLTADETAIVRMWLRAGVLARCPYCGDPLMTKPCCGDDGQGWDVECKACGTGTFVPLRPGAAKGGRRKGRV